MSWCGILQKRPNVLCPLKCEFSFDTKNYLFMSFFEMSFMIYHKIVYSYEKNVYKKLFMKKSFVEMSVDF